MKNFKQTLLTMIAIGSLTLTGCFHIVEEVTFKKDGKGQYKMMIDMSEMKGMMDMVKGMAPDSTQTDSTGAVVGGAEQDNSMATMGQEMSKVSTSLKNIQGITNVVEINDTSAFQFGYTFDFADIAALNRALKVINKEKYESKTDEIFKFNGKTFERAATGDIGAEMKKAMAENTGEEGGDESLEMVKMFFADMSYKQIYHFPESQIKKPDNEMAEISDGGHTMTITIKPFNEEQSKKNPSIAVKTKLK